MPTCALPRRQLAASASQASLAQASVSIDSASLGPDVSLKLFDADWPPRQEAAVQGEPSSNGTAATATLDKDVKQ